MCCILTIGITSKKKERGKGKTLPCFASGVSDVTVFEVGFTKMCQDDERDATKIKNRSRKLLLPILVLG